jgi:hypothetical protein
MVQTGMTTNRSVLKLLCLQYGKGNFAVNSRTPWRTLPALSSRQTGFFLRAVHLGGRCQASATPDCEPFRRFAATDSEAAFPEWFNGSSTRFTRRRISLSAGLQCFRGWLDVF